MGCSSSFPACTAAAAHWFYDAVFIKTLSPLCFYALGSEEGAVFPPLPRGVPAPCRVCLHGGHVALPLRLHHYLHCAPQVRGDFTLNCSFRTTEARVQLPLCRWSFRWHIMTHAVVVVFHVHEKKKTQWTLNKCNWIYQQQQQKENQNVSQPCWWDVIQVPRRIRSVS